MIRNLKQGIRRKCLKKYGVYPKLDIPKTKFGANSGAWTIYAKGINSQSIIYSFGVGTNIDFDLCLISETGATVHAFDPTPVSIDWIRQQSIPPQFIFHNYGIAAYNGELKFYPPRRKTSSHYAPIRRYKKTSRDGHIMGKVYRLSTIMEKLSHHKIDLLKIDIEGGEYEVIPDIVSSNITIDQIEIEFHHSYATVPIRKTLNAIAQLRNRGYEIFHISDRTYEMSLIHQSQLK